MNKITTPICDFIEEYNGKNSVRLHMPGHKGKGRFGFEGLDITEIEGADVLYSGSGIVAESQKNAASLFGTSKTLYSTEGSSLSIRAMTYLCSLYAAEQGKSPLILAARNAHKSFVCAAALVGFDIDWLYSDMTDCILDCKILADLLDRRLGDSEEKPVAFYVTSPDYLGNVADISAIAEVCHKHGVLLVVDNAHGAYLRFLKNNVHPITLGADVCCDSAHKTLPVLTGGGYLHISKNAPQVIFDNAERSMSLFASTSPSYLILQSLDMVNKYLAEGYSGALDEVTEKLSGIKQRLLAMGYTLVGDEPLKITVAPKSYGYKGQAFSDWLMQNNCVCDFADPDYTVLMFTPSITDAELEHLESAIGRLPRRKPISDKPPKTCLSHRIMSVRQAMLSPSEEICVSRSEGRVLADPCVTCPPAIPIVVCGEQINRDNLDMFEYYGIKKVRVIKEKSE